MPRYNMKVLDCTLRDGGYINDWKFGRATIRAILTQLSNANIDIIELGFLRCEKTNEDRTVWNRISQMSELSGLRKQNQLYAVMILHNKYDINMLEPYGNDGIDLVRVTFHDYDYKAGIDFCHKVMERGYMVSCNPINLMGYNDRQILDLIDEVNQLKPYSFSIVDTFGSMGNRDLDRLVSICHHNLRENITLGLHLHENKAQSFPLAQRFIDKHLNRNSIIDGSLNGMGRIPGNLSIELLADYLNVNMGTNYEMDYLLDAIEQYIEPIKKISTWGYSPVYFLSAKYNLHRNYAEYYLNKGNLTHKDINHLLSRICNTKKTVFDEQYAEELYAKYVLHETDDTIDRENLCIRIANRNVLILAPGRRLKNCNKKIREYYQKKEPIVVSLNFIPDNQNVDFAFYTNAKRISQMDGRRSSVIATSNLKIDADYTVNINSIISTFRQGDNSLIMLLRLLKECGVATVGIAGADGYSDGGMQYFDDSLHSYIPHDDLYNEEMKQAIGMLDMDVEFVTESLYE